MTRPTTDEKLCFICQENPPTYKAERLGENFVLCDDCVLLVEKENKTYNKIKQALYLADRTKIFSYALGMDLTPIKIKIEQI